MVYQVRNYFVELNNHGSETEPYLYAISGGQRNNISLIFHIKIENVFHELWLVMVNKTSCNFKCVYPGCTATHRMRIADTYIIAQRGAIKMKNGRFRTKYDIDRSDPNIRNIDNWTVIHHVSKPHSIHENKEFWGYIRKEFREDHTNLGLVIRKPAYQQTLDVWNLRVYGPQVEGTIKQSKQNEKQSAWRKIK